MSNPHSRTHFPEARKPEYGDVCVLLADRGDHVPAHAWRMITPGGVKKEPYIRAGEWVEIIGVRHTRSKGWRYHVQTTDRRSAWVKAEHLQIVGRDQPRATG